MVVGPVFQAAMFMGVIYWYSKGMISLINDYYRDEFKAYLDKEAEKNPRTKIDTILLEESCPAVSSSTVEGLPDILKSTNDHTKSDGIIVRDFDKPLMNNRPCNLKSITTDTTATLDRSEAMASIPKDNDVPTGNVDINQNDAKPDESHASSTKSILNPSEAGQSNCKQMTNQQTSDAPDGVCASEIDSIPSSGNCFEIAETANREYFESDESESQPEPKIIVNGIQVPADVLKKRLKEKLNDNETCRRRSVHDMVQFWTNYIELAESSSGGQQQQQQRLQPPRPRAALATRRWKSNGDIISPNS